MLFSFYSDRLNPVSLKIFIIHDSRVYPSPFFKNPLGYTTVCKSQKFSPKMQFWTIFWPSLESFAKPENTLMIFLFYSCLDQLDDLTPEKYSSALSRLVFAWLDPLVAKGWKKQLDRSDLWSLQQENRWKKKRMKKNE